MSVHTVIRGRIVEGPYSAETGTEELAATFTLGDRQTGLYRRREYDMDDLETCEVICRGDWAHEVTTSLKEGDRVLVVGQLHVSVPIDRYDDRHLVLVTVEAETVGIDLAATD
jgi:single-stranded DNA-binding protein